MPVPKRLNPINEGDLAVCKVFAGLRTASSRRGNIKRPFSNGFEKQMAQEEAGIIAEYAFCKHYNLFFDGAFGGKDDGHDCNIKGRRIDIKSITTASHNLTAHSHTDKTNVDIYVLVYVDGCECYVIGWISKEDFIQEENKKDLGFGLCYFMDQQQLQQW